LIQKLAQEALRKLTLVLKSDAAVREFSGEERVVLHRAHEILSLHQPKVEIPLAVAAAVIDGKL
jgi:hypothetical protein